MERKKINPFPNTSSAATGNPNQGSDPCWEDHASLQPIQVVDYNKEVGRRSVSSNSIHLYKFYALLQQCINE